MLARLILALLLAAFAFPAVAPAACHNASASRGHVVMDAAVMNMASTNMAAMDMAAMDMAAGDRHDAPVQKATPPHGCIGCVPPSNWGAARILGAAPREAAMLVERSAVLDLGTGDAPGLRPPRAA